MNDPVLKKINDGFLNPKSIPPCNIIKKGYGRLAICITTYKSSVQVQEVIDKCIAMYIRYKIDVYIYDSSDDDKTKQLVEEQQKKYSNLFYVRFPADLHSNMKVYKIFQQYAFRKEYEYVWVMQDKFVYRTDILFSVFQNLNQKYDILVINCRDKQFLGTSVYNNKVRFFEDLAWHLTQYGSAVLRVSTLLRDADWEYFLRKFNIKNRVNHSHVGFYFERILSLNKFSAYHISLSDCQFFYTSSSPSRWWKDVFYIWGVFFPDTIDSLPRYSKRSKNLVIKKHGILGGVFTYESFISLRLQGIYNIDVYKEFEDRWYRLTNIARQNLREIALTPPEKCSLLLKEHQESTAKKASRQYKKGFEKECRKKIRRLNSFCTVYKRIYVIGIDDEIERYVVYIKPERKGSIEKVNLKQLSSKQIKEIQNSGNAVGLVLALGKDNADALFDALYSNTVLREGDSVPQNIFCEYIQKNSIDERKRLMDERERLRTFSESHERLYIYGTGKVAKRYTGFLKKMHLRFEGFIVSSKTAEAECFEKQPVYSFEEYEKKASDDSGIIMGLNKKNRSDVLSMFRAKNITLDLFESDIL